MGHDARRLARSLHLAELVYFDEARDLVIEWNGSATFNSYTLDGVPVDTAMSEDAIASADQARTWIEEWIGEATDRIRGGER